MFSASYYCFNPLYILPRLSQFYHSDINTTICMWCYAMQCLIYNRKPNGYVCTTCTVQDRGLKKKANQYANMCEQTMRSSPMKDMDQRLRPNSAGTCRRGVGGAEALEARAKIIQKCPSQTNSNDIVVNKTKCIWILINMKICTKQ